MSEKLLLELYDRVVILEKKVASLEQSLCKTPIDEKNITESNKEVKGKYRYLSDYLLKSEKDVIVLTFTEIEEILKEKLPPSARQHRAMWANTQTHSISRAWYNVGYRTTDVDMENEKIRFEKARYTMDRNITISKYEPIGKYLEETGLNKITLSFSEIENILGFPLPKYLYQYEAGWYGTAEGSPTHRQKAVWCSYGYQVESVDLPNKIVIFYKL